MTGCPNASSHILQCANHHGPTHNPLRNRGYVISINISERAQTEGTIKQKAQINTLFVAHMFIINTLAYRLYSNCRVSKFYTQCYDEVVCPSCIQNVSNSMQFVSAAAICTNRKKANVCHLDHIYFYIWSLYDWSNYQEKSDKVGLILWGKWEPGPCLCPCLDPGWVQTKDM